MKRKKGGIALLIITLAFFAAWATFYIINYMNLFPDVFSAYVNALIGFSEATMLMNILSWAVIGIWLILSIILIAVAAVRKRAAFGWGALLLLLFLFPAFDYVVFLNSYNEVIVQFFTTFDMSIFMRFLMPVLALLTVVFALILYFLVVASIERKEAAEVIEEAAPEEEVVEELEEEPQEENEQPAEYEDLSVEPAPFFQPENEPEEEVEQVEEAAPEVVEEPAPAPVVEEEPAPAPKEEPRDDLKALLKEIVRDIVRDELARNQHPVEPNTNTNNVTGATFGGPLVVQYFTGCTPAQAPIQQTVTAPGQEKAVEMVKCEEPKKEERPAPAPVVKEEPAPAPAVEEQPKEEAPVEEAAPEEAPAEEEKKPIVRIPFEARLLAADDGLKKQYNDLKNYILSYGLKCRTANGGDSFRLHRKTYVKMNIAGKSLKLYLALDPADYADSKMPISDASSKAIYAEIPLVFKVKSDLSYRRALQLIQDACEKDNLEQGEVGKVDWVKEVEANFKDRPASGDYEEEDED